MSERTWFVPFNMFLSSAMLEVSNLGMLIISVKMPVYMASLLDAELADVGNMISTFFNATIIVDDDMSKEKVEIYAVGPDRREYEFPVDVSQYMVSMIGM